MSDGNDTDASGRSSEGSEDLRARLDDIADTVGVVAQAVSDLDHRIQLAQAASTAADQRWEQRITTMESHLAELDAVMRTETEQVRGSTSVLELLSHEIRTSLAQNRDVTEFASGLQESLDALVSGDTSHDVAALTDRMNDVDTAISRIADSIVSLDASLTTVQERQIDPEAVLAAMQRIGDRQPDLDPLLAQLEQMASALPDLSGLHEALDARESDLVPIHHELLALRMTQPDLTEVLDGLQGLRDRQIDLTPVHEELRDLRGSQPDVASVIDALDALQASLPAQFRDLEGRLLDASAFADSLDLLLANQPDVQPIVQAVDALRAQIADFAVPADSPTDDEQDTAAYEQDTAAYESLLTEIRSLRIDPPDLTPVIEAIEMLRAEVPDLAPTTEAVTELRASLGDSLHDRLEALLATALDRQQTESEASRNELRAIEDHLAPIAAALQSATDRLGTIEAVTSAHAEHLAAQSGELIGLRSQTSGLAATIPDAVTRLDVLTDEVRSVAAGTAEPEAVMERLELISTDLDHASRLRETERAELAAVLDGLAEVRSQFDAAISHVASAPSDTETDLVARLDSLADRTDSGLQSVRQSFEERLASLDESRSADAATIRTAVEHVDGQERLVADRLESLAEQMSASSAASEELWLRATEHLAGAEVSVFEPSRLDRSARRHPSAADRTRRRQPRPTGPARRSLRRAAPERRGGRPDTQVVVHRVGRRRAPSP